MYLQHKSAFWSETSLLKFSKDLFQLLARENYPRSCFDGLS